MIRFFLGLWFFTKKTLVKGYRAKHLRIVGVPWIQGSPQIHTGAFRDDVHVFLLQVFPSPRTALIIFLQRVFEQRVQVPPQPPATFTLPAAPCCLGPNPIACTEAGMLLGDSISAHHRHPSTSAETEGNCAAG